MRFTEARDRFVAAFGKNNPDHPIVPVGIKFVPRGTKMPEGDYEIDEVAVPWCGAVKLAGEDGGDVVVMTRDNIGCPAGGIALGLVNEQEQEPLEGPRKYTSLMGQPASPADFTNGLVYACKDAGRMEYSLFGDDDPGRYKTLSAAMHAVSGMAAIRPAMMEAVFAYAAGTLDVEPDVVHLGLTPRQALRTVQAHCFPTGDRFEMSTIGIRGVCADVTAYPFVHQKLNGSFFCLGARALSGWEGNLLSLGMPFEIFCRIVEAMEESGAGFPFAAYPA
jgi:uncharacterized protein (DUF169 family)